MNVSDIMSSPVFSIKQDATVEDAAKLMCDKNVSALPVVDGDNKVVGILTESDFVGKDANIPHALASIKQLFGSVHNFTDVERIYKDTKTKTVDKVMSKNVKTIESSADINSLVSLMANSERKRVPVVEGGVLKGMVTRKDLVKAFLKS